MMLPPSPPSPPLGLRRDLELTPEMTQAVASVAAFDFEGDAIEEHAGGVSWGVRLAPGLPERLGVMRIEDRG